MWAVALTIALPIAIIIILSILLGKNKMIKQQAKQIAETTQKYDSARVINNMLRKTLIDTVNYYEPIIKKNNEDLAREKSKLMNTSEELQKIKNKIAIIPNDSVYSLTLSYLPKKEDSLKYPYSGNQVKDIYEDHLSHLKMIDAVAEYKEYTFNLELGNRNKDKQLSNYKDLTTTQGQQIQSQLGQIKNLSDQTNMEMKKNKRLKIFVPVSGGLGIVVGILIMTL